MRSFLFVVLACLAGNACVDDTPGVDGGQSADASMVADAGGAEQLDAGGTEPEDAGPGRTAVWVRNEYGVDAVVSVEFTTVDNCQTSMPLTDQRLEPGFFGTLRFPVDGPVPRRATFRMKFTTLGRPHFFRWDAPVTLEGTNTEFDFDYDLALAVFYVYVNGGRMLESTPFEFGQPSGCTSGSSSGGASSSTSGLPPSSGSSGGTSASSAGVPDGQSGGRCYGNGTCNAGLTCGGDGVCRQSTQNSSSAAMTSSSSAGTPWRGLSLDDAADSMCLMTLPAMATVSVEFWFRRDTSARTPIVLSSHVYGNGVGLMVGIDGDQMDFRVAGNDVNWAQGLAPPTGQWTHVVGTYDGTQKRLYLNGVQRLITGRSGPVPASPRPLCFGGYADNICDTAYRFLGVVDNFGVWNRALSAAEVLDRMTGAPSMNAPGLVAWFGFDEMTDVVVDAVSGASFPTANTTCGGSVQHVSGSR